MRKPLLIAVCLSLFGLAARGAAVTHYVDVNSANPVAPYLSWATAATTIQDAVNSANNSDTVLVTNGVYSNGVAVNQYGSNRVSITKSITLKSVNGRDVTIIQGQTDPSPGMSHTNTVRCVYVEAAAVSISGFTLTNGDTSSSISLNFKAVDGGGVHWNNTGNGDPTYYRGVISDCRLVGCHSFDAGGGIYATLAISQLLITNCILSGNTAGRGGAAYGGTFYNCIITNNSAGLYGGGVNSGSLTRCMVSGNRVGNEGGGAYYGSCTNCVFAHNSATQGGGYFGGGGTPIDYIVNCTIVSNSAGQGGGIYGYGSGVGLLANSIIYDNSATTNDANWSGSLTNADYCCTIPAISSHDVTNEPGFVNLLAGDFHLGSISPCINSGSNGYVATSVDLDGNPRIRGGIVDIGAYEYQEFLRLLTPQPVQTGVTLTWPSLTNQSYFIQKATNARSPNWVGLQSNIFTASGTNVATYTDTSATNQGPYFYRVGTVR